ncbi:hypothetical protein LXL04_039274 [Taraxacum kok-saghyz]
MDDHDFNMDDGFSQPEAFDDDDDDDDEEDPWKPLNPHEKGNLKLKLTEKIGQNQLQKSRLPKSFHLKNYVVQLVLSSMKHGRHNNIQKITNHNLRHIMKRELRQSLVEGDHDDIGTFNNDKDDEDDGYDNGGHDFHPYDDYMNEDHFNHENHMDDATKFDGKEPVENEEPINANENLEDLCRSHLDSLLASIAETEKQTALAARVSTWKQRIDQNLEEQVNNENVEPERGGIEGGHVCYTGENPFHVRLLTNVKRPEVRLRSANKRPKGQKRGKENLSPGSVSPLRSIKVRKIGGIKRTPESKTRRRSRLVDHDGLMMSSR